MTIHEYGPKTKCVQDLEDKNTEHRKWGKNIDDIAEHDSKLSGK